MKKEPVAPGDDICPVPAPVDEVPPLDRYCDLVLTGGVASGVVYPWAIVELARAYRFRNIGGTSVGAMAAALAAAAEYGRRTGYEMPFETLRRLPAALGEELPDGRTRMLSLFQPAPQGRRLIRLWARLFQGMPPGSYDRKTQDPPASAAPESPESPESPPAPVAAPKVRIGPVIAEVAKAYGAAIASGAFGGALLAWAIGNAQGQHAAWTTVVLGLALAVVCAALALLADLRHDIRRGIVDNGLGLCKGGTLEPQDPDDPRPGLSEWLHEGIQRSAGLKLSDPPLTFGDLWTAPAYPGAPLTPCTDADPPGLRAINLQMISTNVTHGRPYRLPLADETSRLFFRPDELRPYLPRAVFDALLQAAPSYVPRSSSDPPAGDDTRELRELPGAGLPVAAAARLSLSFPLLFSAVPLYAIDYEQREAGSRRLRRCWFTDGGVSSNFPIHIFDAALPRWPTFGLWLGRQDPYQRPDDALVWLPDFHGRGWGDNWNRFDPATLPTMAEGATTPPAAVPAWLAPWKMLGGFLLGLATLGFDLTRVTVLLSAFGVGIGFGLQEIVNNFVSGLILLLERPVKVGDTVQVGSVSGEVRHIGIRSSSLRTFDGADVIVPNGEFVAGTVTNWTLADRQRRIEIPVGVAYGSDPERVMALLRGVAVNNDGADKAGYYAPSLSGQANVIDRVLRDTGVDVETID